MIYLFLMYSLHVGLFSFDLKSNFACNSFEENSLFSGLILDFGILNGVKIVR